MLIHIYSSAITFKDLTIKVGREAELYHHVTAYDNIISYARISFVVIVVESMIIYHADRKLRHSKRHYNIMGRQIHVSRCTILYFIRTHLALIIYSVFSLYHGISTSDIPHAYYNSNSLLYMLITY